MKNKLLVFTIVILGSCGKENKPMNPVYQAGHFHFIDSSGNELFSYPYDGQNGYYIDSVNVYNITNAKIKLKPCYDNNQNNYTFQDLDELRTQICPNNDFINRYSLTLIELKKGMSDTIKMHIDNDVTVDANVDSIWYNGVLKSYNSQGDIDVVK